MNQRRTVALFSGLIAFAPAWPVLAQSAENVAVVVNDLSPDSKRIGEHYARARGLPASNVLRIQTVASDVIERDEYVRAIERPLGKAIARAGLQDRLLFLVLTKGVPLRIAGTTGLQGTTASVDSELTLLYRRLVGQPVPTAGMVDNPYYLGTRELDDARPFSHRQHDIYLVTRLDGFTVDDAMTLVDRAQAATAGTHDRQIAGKIVLDQSASPPASQSGDEWLQRAARRLKAAGHEARVVLETTPQAARGIEGVIGRFAWGATDPSQRSRTPGMTFEPGAIAANLASFDARTFQPPPDTWQPTSSPDRASWFEGSGDGLIGDLIREGVTGVSGQVGEAYLRGAVRPEILFPAYLAGFTLAEAFYLATPTLSWQTVVIGDPLTAPFPARRQTRAELEDDLDDSTGLPGLFSRRRMATVAAANPNVPAAALAAVLRTLTSLEKEDKSGAARALADVVTASPRTPIWLSYVATLQEQAGDYIAAVATYQEVLKIQPTNVVALNNLAYALAVHLRRPAEALPHARRAMSLAPRAGVIIDTLAWTEHLLGNHEAASKLLAEAIRLEPKQAEIRLHAAIVYAARGTLDRSVEELKEALRLQPELASREDVMTLQGRLSPSR
jgi:uncharacterized protein (TIGR03790 family)